MKSETIVTTPEIRITDTAGEGLSGGASENRSMPKCRSPEYWVVDPAKVAQRPHPSQQRINFDWIHRSQACCSNYPQAIPTTTGVLYAVTGDPKFLFADGRVRHAVLSMKDYRRLARQHPGAFIRPEEVSLFTEPAFAPLNPA